jgi:hypothetical protein
MDDKGNALNADGSIFMTKEKMESFSNTLNDNDLITEVEKINNIIIIGEDNKPIKYEATPQGIAKRELDIISNVKVQAQQEGINTFLKSNPDLKSIYDYKQRHGSIEGYDKVVDYTTINIDKNNKDQLKQFIIDEQISKGNTIAVAKSFAEFAEKNNQLEELGIAAHTNLKANQVAKIQEQQTKIKESNNKYYGIDIDQNGNIKDLNIPGSLYDIIVKKGEFNGMKIPKDGVIVKNNDGSTSKLNTSQLFELAAYADNNGLSRLDNIISNYISKAENKVAVGLYILKGGDLSELVNNAVNKQQVTKFKINTSNNKSNTKQINNNSSVSKQDVVTPVK